MIEHWDKRLNWHIEQRGKEQVNWKTNKWPEIYCLTIALVFGPEFIHRSSSSVAVNCLNKFWLQVSLLWPLMCQEEPRHVTTSLLSTELPFHNHHNVYMDNLQFAIYIRNNNLQLWWKWSGLVSFACNSFLQCSCNFGLFWFKTHKSKLYFVLEIVG